MAEPTGVTTTGVEDDAEIADLTDDEFGADVPSEYTTETAQDAPGRRPAPGGHRQRGGHRPP